MALTDKLTAIADAIRNKTGGTDELTLEQMATEIEGISTGGGAVSVPTKDVNFYDYDGTCLHAYTVAEAQALSELPALPEREGLICQGWNWSLEDIKAHNRALNVGATYTTDDGTTRIYIHLEEGRTSPMLGARIKGTVTVDWGDGTEPDVLTGDERWGSTVRTPNHEYAKAGDYVIRLAGGGEVGFSASNYGAIILTNSATDSDQLNGAYRNAVRRIELGNNATSIQQYSFFYCYSLNSIVIPNSVTTIEKYAFHSCYSLNSIVIPNSATSIGGDAFYYCYSLHSIVIPNSVTGIGEYCFYSCYSLHSIVIPNSVKTIGMQVLYMSYALNSIIIPNGLTSVSRYMLNDCKSLVSVLIPNSVTSIGANAFDGNSSMRIYDFTKSTAVPTLDAVSAFNGIPADCEIRVPAALYDEWIAATNWSTYASKIVAV